MSDGARTLAMAALLAAGCLPPVAPIEGKECDGDHPCGGELLCRAGRCTADAGTPGENLLANGGFESQLADWGPGVDSQVEVQTAVKRSGSRAARVFPMMPPGSFVGLTLDKNALSPLQSGSTYCVEAWVQRGTVTGAGFTVVVRTFDSGGASVDAPVEAEGRFTPANDAWFPLRASVVVTPPRDAQLNFRVSTPAPTATTQFFVDDCRVWIGAAGRCD